MRLSDFLRTKKREVPDKHPEEPFEEQPVVRLESRADDSVVQRTVTEQPEERPALHEFDDMDRYVLLDMALIQPNPYQPRRQFAEESLAGLARSIEERGLLQPIVVRRVAGGYQLLMGERRLRACELLGWKRIPAIIREVEEKEAAVAALIENLQREDLDLFEEIEGMRRLRDDFGLTQTQIAGMLGLSQSAIANKLRLLQLSTEVRELISRERLSERHARALLQLESRKLQLEVLQQVIDNHLTVKETEALIRNKLDELKTGMNEDIQLLITRIHQLIAEFADHGVEIEMQQRKIDGYIEVGLRIQTGKGY